MCHACVESLWSCKNGVYLGISADSVKCLKGHFYKVLSSVGDAVAKVNHVAAKVVGDISALQHTAKLCAYTAAALEIARGCTQVACRNVHDSLIRFSDFIDATRLFVNGNVFVSGQAKQSVIEGRRWKVAGQAALVISGIAGLTLWLARAGVVNLAKLAQAVGSLKVFNFIGEVNSLRTFVLSAAGTGLSYLAIDAMLQIAGGGDVTQSWLDLANCVAEVALIVFLLSGACLPVVHVGLGLAAAGTGLGAFVYKVTKPEKPKQEEVPVDVTSSNVADGEVSAIKMRAAEG